MEETQIYSDIIVTGKARTPGICGDYPNLWWFLLVCFSVNPVVWVVGDGWVINETSILVVDWVGLNHWLMGDWWIELDGSRSVETIDLPAIICWFVLCTNIKVKCLIYSRWWFSWWMNHFVHKYACVVIWFGWCKRQWFLASTMAGRTHLRVRTNFDQWFVDTA